ncbi:hypothetical protein AB0C87_06090 [Actinomadura sp. NPDC048021]|uniref:hypothetical protein n=1 Tax=Actinomadura sp. NPDC048021 TaxID=3155385 RepID=UPI0033EAB3BC
MTSAELAATVVRDALALPPIEAISLLLQSHRAGLAVLPEYQAARAEALLDRAPGRLPVEDPATTSSEADAAWQLYSDSERIWHVRLDVEQQRRLLENLPLSVVDDLIDAKRVSTQAVPEDGDRRSYLLARLAPAQLNREELVELDWQEELIRQDFTIRLASGDLAVLNDIDALTGAQHRLATALRKVRTDGEITPELIRQRWLWPALERLAPDATLSVPQHKPYARWLLLRRTIRIVRKAHEARLRGDEQNYHVMLQNAWRTAKSLQGIRADVGWEARNILAYLIVLRAGRTPNYDEALNVLDPPPELVLSEDKLPQEARLHLRANRQVLHAIKDQHKNAYVINPYILLGVPDGFPNWKKRWRDLRVSLDADGEAHINEAKDAIQAWERGRSSLPPYALPLLPNKWANPSVRNNSPSHHVTPMPRRTPPSTEDERELTREGAAQGIALAARSTIGSHRPTISENYFLEGDEQ